MSGEWLGYLLSGAKSTKVNGAKSAAKGSGKVGDFTTDDAREYVGQHGSGALCRAMRLVLKAEKAKLGAEVEGSRYDHAVEGSMALVRLISEGHRGGAQAISELGAAYLDAVKNVTGRDPSEWPRMVTGAVAAVSAVEVKQHDRGDCPMPAIEHDSSIWPSPQAPYLVAQRFIVEKYTTGDGSPEQSEVAAPTLVSWRGGWYHWTGTYWSELPESALRAQLYAALSNVTYIGASKEVRTEMKWKPDRGKIGNVLDAMRAAAHRSDFDEETRDGSVAFSNGVLDLATRDLRPHSPKRFNLAALTYEMPASSPSAPRWLEFLDQLWPGDSESIELLQEWFGYVLSGRTNMHTIMLMVGPPRAGKGIISRVLSALVGEHNTTGPTLAQLATDFGMAPLIGKSLAVIGDARFSGRNGGEVVERLLSISGEDVQTVNRKNREMWNGQLAGARFMVLTNEVPSLIDSSGALSSRFALLRLRQTFLGREDRELEPAIVKELPGILMWALDGYDRISRHGARFATPVASLEAHRELEELGAPEKAFMREHAVRDPDAVLAMSDLYSAFRMWCDDNGRERPVTLPIFGRNLRAAYPDLRFGQSRQVSGADSVVGSDRLQAPTPYPRRCVFGVRLRSPEESE